MRIQTDRLLIRSFELADIPAYAEIVADPRVVRGPIVKYAQPRGRDR